jgi:hypothetical protein
LFVTSQAHKTLLLVTQLEQIILLLGIFFLTLVAMTAIYNASTKEEAMPRLGFGIASVGMLLLVLLTGVEPTTDTAFWIHVGLMYIAVATLGLGAVLMYKK